MFLYWPDKWVRHTDCVANEVVTKLTHVAAPPCVPVIRSGRYVDSALFVQAEVKSDDWNASWRHQTNGALSDNPIPAALVTLRQLAIALTRSLMHTEARGA